MVIDGVTELHPDLVIPARNSRIMYIAFLVMAVAQTVLAFVLPVSTPVYFGQPLIRLVLLFDAVVVVALGWVFAGKAQGWYQRASALLGTVPPRRMRLSLRIAVDENRGRSLFADLTLPAADADAKPVSYAMLTPKWDTSVVADGTDVDVYADAAPGGPLVINTPYGLLWASQNLQNRFRRLP